MTPRIALVLLGLAACTPSKGESVTREPALAASTPAIAERSWPKPAPAELAKRLTPLQLKVTQEAATEPPFQNAYWNNHAPGLYVDVVTGEPLFSSQDKFESGTGWPSFTRPVDARHVIAHTDSTLGMERTEVVSTSGRSHLGHVFDDGPAPTHMRYCINSASLRFVPAAQLAAEGYGEYAASFGVAPAAVEPVATSNSCALPPPGKAPGCSATLDVAIFSRSAGDERLAKVDGVLDLVHGFEDREPATQITFDPTKLSYETLFGAITAGHEKQTKIFARDTAQRDLAKSRSLAFAEAVPFVRSPR